MPNNEDSEDRAVVLQFWVPVYVAVKNGRIEKVIVDDETNPVFTYADGDMTYTEEAKKIAMAGDAEWPAWQFG